jgi:hypothetical protein
MTVSCPILPGASGGPLVDDIGHAIGVAHAGRLKPNGEFDESIVVLLDSIERVAEYDSKGNYVTLGHVQEDAGETI